MHIWHDTLDAPRRPGRVSPGEVAEIIVGTWPIEPGQSVQVLWEGLTGAESRTGGTIAARWQRNDTGNSYWTAQLAPLFYDDRSGWTWVMQHAIALNGSFFDTDRTVRQYVQHAYARAAALGALDDTRDAKDPEEG